LYESIFELEIIITSTYFIPRSCQDENVCHVEVIRNEKNHIFEELIENLKLALISYKSKWNNFLKYVQ